MKTTKVNRIVRLLTTLQSGKSYSVEELMDHLQISRRTVFRDLKALEEIGVPYYYDSKSGGYSIEQSYYLQPIDLKLTEALSLLMLIQKTRKMIPFPFHRSAVMAGLKIENNLPSAVKQFCNTTLDTVSYKKGRVIEDDGFEKIFSDLQKAIRENYVCCMNYKSLFDKKNIVTDIDPYHLIYNHRAWYLIGHSHIHKQVRTFKLSRINELNLCSKKFLQDKKFDPEEYFGKAWSMIPEGRMWNVKLAFDPVVANNVTEVHWHTTQKCQWNIDGSVEIEFRIDGLNEVLWWILGYGDKVKVIKPLELKKRLLNVSEKMVKNYTP